MGVKKGNIPWNKGLKVGPLSKEAIKKRSETRIKNKLGIGKKNPAWNGGRFVDNRSGYVFIYVDDNSMFSLMAGKYNRHVPEHRLVMAKHLGRCLESWEIVHHKNRIKNDNEIENLEIVTPEEHSYKHLDRSMISQLKKEIKELRILLLMFMNQKEVITCQR